MTARFLHSLPARNALRVVKQNGRLGIVMCVLFLLGAPVIMASLVAELALDAQDLSYHMSMGAFAALGGFCAGVAVFLGMIVGIGSLTETHKKSKVDMLYALPLTGSQRFFSDYIGGLCLYIVPYLISYILGWLIFLCGIPLIQAGPKASVYTADLPEAAKYYALFGFGLLALMLLYYTMTVFITVCCGTLFESIYTNILLNLLLPGTVASGIAIAADLSGLDFEYLWTAIGYMSPIGGLIYLIYLITDGGPEFLEFGGSYGIVSGSESIAHNTLTLYFRWMLIILVITAALLVGAWQLYIRRKAEHVGRPFVYNVIYFVMITLLSVLILCLCAVEDDIIIAVIIFTAIVYLVMEIIRKRGFRRFWVSLISFALTVVLSFGLYAIVDVTDCFGRVNYVPAAATVSSVRLNLERINTVGSGNALRLEYTDRSIISAVTDLHKASVKRKGLPGNDINKRMSDAGYGYLDFENYYNEGWYEPARSLFKFSIPRNQSWHNTIEYDEATGRYYDEYGDEITDKFIIDNYNTPYYYADTTSLEVTYYMLTGSQIHRRIELTYDELYDLMRTIEGTDLFREAFRIHMANAMETTYSSWDSDTNKRTIPYEIKLELLAQPRSYSNAPGRSIAVTNGPAVIDALVEAYCTDYEATTFDERMTSPIYGALYNYPVYDCFTETIKLLEGYGFKPYNVAQRYNFADASMSDAENQAADYRYAIGVRIYEPDSWTIPTDKYQHSTLTTPYVLNGKEAYDDCIPLGDSLSLESYYPELYDLLNAAQPRCITDEDCYLICLGSERLVVRPEHADLVKAVIDKGSFYVRDTVFEMDGTGFYTDPSGTIRDEFGNDYYVDSKGNKHSYNEFDWDNYYGYDYDPNIGMPETYDDDEYFYDDDEYFYDDDQAGGFDEDFDGNSAPQSSLIQPKVVG